jgi:hypothetical protein
MDENIKYGITGEQVKSIFGNLINQNKFLWYMRLDWNLPIKKNRKGEGVLDISKIGDVTDYIVNHWEYISCRDTIRNMYVLSDKYKNCRNAKEVFKVYQEMYRNDGYLEYEYPYVANNYDSYVTRTVTFPSVYNPELFESSYKKHIVDSKQYCYLKNFSMLKNDYIEYLMFNSNIDVIPTFGKKKGLDFFINGEGFDQKVSKSTTNEFKRDYGDNWRESSINDPYEVCKYLMMYGDEARFSNVPRLFVINIDGNYDLDGIEDIIKDINFDSPRVVEYVYNHKSTGNTKYSCKVICILLTNPT